jgi:hypothetical protein
VTDSRQMKWLRQQMIGAGIKEILVIRMISDAVKRSRVGYREHSHAVLCSSERRYCIFTICGAQPVNASATRQERFK